MNCNHCSVVYDTLVHKPIVLFDCFHYFCNSCVLNVQKCPKCNQDIKSKAVNWDTLELIQDQENITAQTAVTAASSESNIPKLKAKKKKTNSTKKAYV